MKILKWLGAGEEGELKKDLEAMGFGRNPVAVWKTIAGTVITEKKLWYMVHSPNKMYGLELPENAKSTTVRTFQRINFT